MFEQSTVIDKASEYLAAKGYAPSNLVREYTYTYRSGPTQLARTRADLVAFSGLPHNIDTSCLAVVADRDIAKAREDLQRLRYLATPVALLFSEREVELWALKKDLPPKPFLEAPLDEWQERLGSRLPNISPETIAAAKKGDSQLSFVDLGIREWAEDIAEQALVSMLESLVADSLEQLPASRRDIAAAQKAVLRLVCQLFACRVLEDKAIIPPSATPREALTVGASHFPSNIDPAILQSSHISHRITNFIFGRLKDRFVFDSLTTRMLGHAYENALVTPYIRKHWHILYT